MYVKSSGGKLGVFLTLFLSSLLIIGCDRKVTYQNLQGEKAEVTFSNLTSSRHDLQDMETADREIEWTGDATSRIIFYANTPSYGETRLMLATTFEEDSAYYTSSHFLAYDTP